MAIFFVENFSKYAKFKKFEQNFCTIRYIVKYHMAGKFRYLADWSAAQKFDSIACNGF